MVLVELEVVINESSEVHLWDDEMNSYIMKNIKE